MHKAINYLKFLSIFMILELMITFITSLLNLLGINSGITAIILLVVNVIIFFVLNFINARKKLKKGYLEGMLLSIIFILSMVLLKIILFNNKTTISTYLYYLILFITGVFGGMVGINKKEEN